MRQCGIMVEVAIAVRDEVNQFDRVVYAEVRPFSARKGWLVICTLQDPFETISVEFFPDSVDLVRDGTIRRFDWADPNMLDEILGAFGCC